MHFTKQEIDHATRLKGLELDWNPTAGDYIFDASNALRPSSPFQDGVYFILDLDCFLHAVGGLDAFKRLMVSNAHIHDELKRARAFDEHHELTCLYHLIEEIVVGSRTARHTPANDQI